MLNSQWYGQFTGTILIDAEKEIPSDFLGIPVIKNINIPKGQMLVGTNPEDPRLIAFHVGTGKINGMVAQVGQPQPWKAPIDQSIDV